MYAETGQSILNTKSQRYYDYYEYIKSHSLDVLNTGYIGKGLSKRFISHAQEKHRPLQFALWTPKYTGNKKIDKQKELRVIPMELQDVPKKRKNDETHEGDSILLPPKKRRISFMATASQLVIQKKVCLPTELHPT